MLPRGPGPLLVAALLVAPCAAVRRPSVLRAPSCIVHRRQAVGVLRNTLAAALIPIASVRNALPCGAEEPAPQTATAPAAYSAFDFRVPFRGEPEEIKPYLGKATLIVNVKYDDPETTEQLPALQGFVEKYSKQGLSVLAFPTDQGWFEADDSATLRLKFKQAFNFGQYPVAMVFDKADLLGSNSLPLYAWLTRALVNPWGVNRLVFNYEKFLLDKDGLPLRRYPRKFPVGYMEEDLKAALAGQPLPPPTKAYIQAWEDAKREATKSEYAFKPGLNYYSFGSPAS